jgi:hypothetical protein
LRGDGDGAEGLRGLGLASRFFGAKAMGAGRNDETWGGFLELRKERQRRPNRLQAFQGTN